MGVPGTTSGSRGARTVSTVLSSHPHSSHGPIFNTPLFKRPWLVAALFLVLLGTSLESYQMFTQLTSDTPKLKKSGTGGTSARQGTSRLSIMRQFVEALSPDEKRTLADILGDLKSSPVSSDSKNSHPSNPAKPPSPPPGSPSEMRKGPISVDLVNGLVNGSVVHFSGKYEGGCFAFELHDEEKKDIQLHVNFRSSEIVASHYIWAWGPEHRSGNLLSLGQAFTGTVFIVSPAYHLDPWTVNVFVNEKKIFSKILLQKHWRIRKASIHEECNKNGPKNTYAEIRVENAPDKPAEKPQMVFDQRVTPAKPGDDLEMLIGILSEPENKEERGGQRRSWLNHKYCTSGRGLVRFFIGKTGNASVDKMVEEEAEKTGDIVILNNLKEDYYRIAEKTKAMVHMAVRYNAKFLLKCDDDTYFDIDQAIEGIRGQPGGLVLAAITYNGGASRSGKWAMPKEDWPHAKYPPFPHGPGYIIGEDILRHADKKLKSGELKALALEDVSMGVWINDARSSGVSVKYVSRHAGKGGVDIGGCTPGGMVAHYMIPEQMVCMWERQKRGEANLCCAK
ncbi:hypothetical protein AAMO2058_001125900 [Amorphochlora amoebiformis]